MKISLMFGRGNNGGIGRPAGDRLLRFRVRSGNGRSEANSQGRKERGRNFGPDSFRSRHLDAGRICHTRSRCWASLPGARS